MLKEGPFWAACHCPSRGDEEEWDRRHRPSENSREPSWGGRPGLSTVSSLVRMHLVDVSSVLPAHQVPSGETWPKLYLPLIRAP